MAQWDESKHPRNQQGEFSSGGDGPRNIDAEGQKKIDDQYYRVGHRRGLAAPSNFGVVEPLYNDNEELRMYLDDTEIEGKEVAERQKARRQRHTKMFEEGVADAKAGKPDRTGFVYPTKKQQLEPRSLYIHRPVLNANELIRWAKDNGYKTTIPADDLHVTVAFSRTPIVWPDPLHDQVIVPASQDRLVQQFDGGARVLRFASPELERRWQELRDKGASWDHDGYKPHITITYQDNGQFDPQYHKYTGPIILGGEQLAEVNEDWKEGVVEKAINPSEQTTFRIVGRPDPGDVEPVKRTQGEVAYQLSPSVTGQRCGRCSYFRAPMSCSQVVDPISEDGWCQLFYPRNDRLPPTEVVTMKNEQVQKAGARHSKSDMEDMQMMHDLAVRQGAMCGNGKDEQVEKRDYKIAKVDESLGMVFGYAIISKVNGQDYYDLNVDLTGPHQGQKVPEHIPEATMLKAAIEFAQTARVGNEMHKGPDIGTYVFVFPLTTDIAKAMGITTSVTGMMIGYKPPPEILAKFKDGTLKGFSIEGRRLSYSEHD